MGRPASRGGPEADLGARASNCAIFRCLTYARNVRTLRGAGFGTEQRGDESDPEEQRFVALGMGAAGRLLVVVYAWRGENIRIISARPAEAHEREEYEAER